MMPIVPWWALFAQNSGQVTSAAGYKDEQGDDKYRIIVTGDNGVEEKHELMKFARTNQGTCINQCPAVNKGDRVEPGQVIELFLE